MRWVSILMIALLPGIVSACGPASRGKSAPESAGGGGGQGEEDTRDASARGGSNNGSGQGDDEWRPHRERMVRTQIEARGIEDTRVLEAMRKVPRHLFIPEMARGAAHEDGPVAIGEGQTISQPYIVALMTELIRPKATDRVLEIGTGSGYQAAILAELVEEVYTIEIVPPLGRRAAALLSELGYTNIHTKIGDGFRGWPEAAPFDAILVTAAPEAIPQPLKEQLAVGGRLVIPVGLGAQDLVLLTRTSTGYKEESITPVRFVPMTGEAERDQ